MEEVRKVQRGPKGSLTPFQRVSQSLYRKSAGVLQDVLEFLQDVCNFLQVVQKWDFGGWMDEER